MGVGPLAVVQARTGSSRLPGKALLPLAGAPLLVRVVERVRAAETIGRVVVATTTDPADDAIADLSDANAIDCYRGHATDLLDRHYRCAKAFRAETVLKIPSDCPLIDTAVIDRVTRVFLDSGVDFVSNLHPATYPDGNDVEVMTFSALERAWRDAGRDFEREHTTPYIWDNPDRFSTLNVEWETGLDYSMSHRFTIDYPEDYAFIRAVYDALHPARPLFGLNEILTLLEERPEIGRLNAKYAGVNWYRHHLDDLKTVGPDQTRRI